MPQTATVSGTASETRTRPSSIRSVASTVSMGSSTAPSPPSPTNSQPRIPLALQQVFLQSQRGENVEKISAPKGNLGFRMFKRAWNGFRNHSKVHGKASGGNGKDGGSKKQPLKSSLKTSSQGKLLMKAPSTSSLTSLGSRKSMDSDSVVTTTTTTSKRPTAADASRAAMAEKRKSGSSAATSPSKPKSMSTVGSTTSTSPTKQPKKETIIQQESPQVYLDKMLAKRGYSTTKYCSLEGGYYCRPTPYQQASYGVRISQAVRGSDSTTLRRLLDCGLSSNPCNNFGESLIHMVCRRGDSKILRILLEAGCSLQVTDDYGRTPLHDACWRNDPSFDTVQLILDSDVHLLSLLDCRGAAPLSYVKKDNYAKWINFLQSKMDRFWPIRDVNTEGDERPPPLTVRKPHSLPIPDPPHALPLEVATMVSNGRMEPEEALYLDDDDDDDDSDVDSDNDDDSDSEYDSDDDDDSEYDSDDDSEFDEAEMAEFCLRAGGPMLIAQKAFGKDVRVVTSGKHHVHAS